MDVGIAIGIDFLFLNALRLASLADRSTFAKQGKY
jgi:hypothetical protein